MDTTPTITHAGQLREMRIGNAAFIRFQRLGGDFQKLESDPVGQAITLACAALDLPGDPLDHADDFPPIPQWADQVMRAVKIYMGEADTPGEPDGGARQPEPASTSD